MAQVLEKTFECKTCHKQIKLSRKDDNSGWNRWELDSVTVHVCEDNNNNNKKFKSSQTLTAVQDLKKLVENLNTTVNSMRMEIAELRKQVAVSKQ